MAMIATEKTEKLETDAFIIHPYAHRFDAGLAEMWNESDDQWPGTFNHGVPMTEARVRDWMDNVGAVMRMVVVEKESGKVVGYGDLWDDLARPGSCYVSLLNVHPAFQGRSLARRMLTAMVDWAVEHEYDRLDIGTWPSNLKAMPLYKKTGFFWQPDTNVHMENYVPAVRRIPALSAFFERHDWYRSYIRELAQREDDMRHPQTGDVPVYVMRWEADGEVVEAVADRNAQSLTGLRTDAWAVYARVSEPEPAQGVAFEAEWEFANFGRMPVQVALSASGDPGIEVSMQERFILEPGERRTLAEAFQVAVDAPEYKVESRELPTPKIASRITIDGQQVDLASGLRYRPAVEFSTEPEVISLTPGVPETVHLQLQSRVNGPLEGSVRLDIPDGLSVDWQPEDLTLSPQGTAGLALTMTAEKEAILSLGASLAFEYQGQSIVTRNRQFAVAALSPGGWVAGRIEDRLVMENDFFRLTTRTKSGHSELFSKLMGRKEAELGEELGLPFVPWDLAEQTYDMALETGGREAEALLTVRSTRFPGLVVERRLTMGGSPVIRVRTRVSNERGEPWENVQVRPMSRYLRAGSRHLVAPLRYGQETRVVREHGGIFGFADGDVPEKPELWGQCWLALEQPGYVFGTIWSEENLEKVASRRGQLYLAYRMGVLAPESAFQAPDVQVYSGPGDWHTVQALWLRLNGQPAAQPEEAFPAPAGRHFEIGIQPNPVLTLEGAVDASLQAHTTREQKVYGTLVVRPPAGWRVDLRHSTLDGVDNTAPFERRVRFQARDDRPGAYQGVVRLESTELDAERPFTLIRLGTAGGEVRVRSEGELWRIENGRTVWEVAPAFSGAVVRWSEAGSEANHLLTSYPESGELSWIKPWYGGLRPVLFDYVRDESWPGKLHESAFEAHPIADSGPDGITWEGLRLSAVPKAPEFAGLRLTLDYLTVAGSNLLKVCYRLVNESAVFRKAEPALLSFFQVDGAHENAVIHAHGLQRKRTPDMAWPNVGSWVAVENPETGRAMATVAASGYRRQIVMDWGLDGGHTYVMDYFNVPPLGSRELIAYYALAETLQEARNYEALAGVGEASSDG